MIKFTSHFVESRLFVKILSLISSLALTSSYCCSTYFVILTLSLKHEVLYFTESSFSHSSQEPHSSTIFIEEKKKKGKNAKHTKTKLENYIHISVLHIIFFRILFVFFWTLEIAACSIVLIKLSTDGFQFHCTQNLKTV